MSGPLHDTDEGRGDYEGALSPEGGGPLISSHWAGLEGTISCGLLLVSPTPHSCGTSLTSILPSLPSRKPATAQAVHETPGRAPFSDPHEGSAVGHRRSGSFTCRDRPQQVPSSPPTPLRSCSLRSSRGKLGILGGEAVQSRPP